jgi:SSS family solute:Na+ symporter
MGGMEALFEEVRTTNEALLSTPGPHGLFTVQFLIASFFGVVLLPATQPQLTTRLIVLKDRRALNRMAVAVGCFALLILFPVAVIGMYGAVAHPVAETRDFLSSVLLFEQPGILAAAAVIGLLTAAMSTADSQIFALGTELRSLMRGPTRVVLPRTKWAVVAFGVAALVFSVVSSDQLVLLARVSFNGTALVGPMVLAGVLMKKSPGMHVVAATAVALLVFLLSLVGLVPEMAGPIRLDLLLLLLLGIVTATSAFLRHTKDTMVNVQQ